MIPTLPRTLIAALPSLALLAACNSEGPYGINDVVCTLEARAALNVELLDAATKASIAAGATVVATDGAYTDTLRNFGNGPFGGAYERVGTYTIKVTTPAHGTATRTGIVVTRDQCHVIAQRITIEMTRVP